MSRLAGRSYDQHEQMLHGHLSDEEGDNDAARSGQDSGPRAAAASIAAPSKIDIAVGRPDLHALFAHIQERHDVQREVRPCSPGSSEALHQSRGAHVQTGVFRAPPQHQHVGVFACGPRELIEQAQDSAMLLGWHLHKETFEL
jgi:hypothetical protein